MAVIFIDKIKKKKRKKPNSLVLLDEGNHGKIRKTIKRGGLKGRPKYAKLRALGRDRYIEVENLLLSGESMVELARFMQTQWGAYPDESEASVVTMLKRFKREVIVPKINNAAKVLQKSDRTVLSTLNATIDVGQELMEIIEFQKGRVHQLSLVELEDKKILGSLRKEIKLLLECLGALHKYKVDLGMLDRLKEGGPLVQMNVLNSVNEFHQNVAGKDQLAEATAKAIELLGNPNVIDAEITNA